MGFEEEKNEVDVYEGSVRLRYDMCRAAASGDVEKLKRPVEREGRSVTVADGMGHFPLQWTELNDQLDAARYLIEHGADVEVSDLNGQKALHWSAMWGSTKVAELLLPKGVWVHAADKNGFQCRQRMLQFNMVKLLSFITL